MMKPVQKFNWNRWLIFYGLCFLALYWFNMVAPGVYCGLSLALLCVQGAISNFRREKQQQIKQVKLALQNTAAHYGRAVVTGANMFFGWFASGELDNSGLFEALKRHKDKCKEDEELRRAFCESYRIETELRQPSAMDKMARDGLMGGHIGVSAEQAMAGLSNIKQVGLSAQQSQALSSGCRNHYDFMKR